MRNLRYGLQEKSAHRFNTLADILSKIARKVSKNRKFKLNQQALITTFIAIYGMLIVKKKTGNAWGCVLAFCFIWNAL